MSTKDNLNDELGFEFDVQGPEETQLKTTLINWSRVFRKTNVINAIIMEYPKEQSAPTKFGEFYKDFFKFQDQVVLGFKQDGLRLIELQKARGVINQDLIDYVLS